MLGIIAYLAPKCTTLLIQTFTADGLRYVLTIAAQRPPRAFFLAVNTIFKSLFAYLALEINGQVTAMSFYDFLFVFVVSIGHLYGAPVRSRKP